MYLILHDELSRPSLVVVSGLINANIILQMAAEVKLYESARKDMYAAIEASNPHQALQLFQAASSKFALFLQDASKSYGVYIDLVAGFCFHDVFFL